MSDYVVTNSKKMSENINERNITPNIFENDFMKVMNILPEMKQLITMTPNNGYQKKIELVINAKDMTTREKLAAIESAENKYTQDLNKNAELYKNMLSDKIALFIGCAAGIMLMVSSSDGRKIAKLFLKQII